MIPGMDSKNAVYISPALKIHAGKKAFIGF